MAMCIFLSKNSVIFLFRSEYVFFVYQLEHLDCINLSIKQRFAKACSWIFWKYFNILHLAIYKWALFCNFQNEWFSVHFVGYEARWNNWWSKRSCDVILDFYTIIVFNFFGTKLMILVKSEPSKHRKRGVL